MECKGNLSTKTKDITKYVFLNKSLVVVGTVALCTGPKAMSMSMYVDNDDTRVFVVLQYNTTRHDDDDDDDDCV